MHEAFPCRARVAKRRSRALTLAALLGTTFITSAATSVAWATVDDDLVDVTGLARVEEPALDDLRGGFSLGPWEITFGVLIKTTIQTATEQVSVLQTSFNVYKPGQISEFTQQFLQTAPVAAEAAQNAAQQAMEAAQQAAQQAMEAAQQAAQQAVDAAQQAAQQVVNLPAQQDPVQQTTQESVAQTMNIPAPMPEQVIPDVQSFPTIEEALNSISGPSDDTGNATQQALAASSDQHGAGTSPSTFVLKEIEGGIAITNGMGMEIVQQVTNGIVTQIVNQMNGVDISHSTELNIFVSNFSTVADMAATRSITDNLALQSIINNPLLGQ